MKVFLVDNEMELRLLVSVGMHLTSSSRLPYNILSFNIRSSWNQVDETLILATFLKVYVI